MDAQEQHGNRVQRIQQQLKDAPGTIVLEHGISHCVRSFDYKKERIKIDISSLNKILEINVRDKFVILEPLVTMEQLTRFTAGYGLVIPVTTELKFMTIGGAIQGLGGESSSFKYGFIDENVLEYELLLGDGTLLTLKKDDPRYLDLFNAIPGSFGSLAIITKIKMTLVEATKYIRVVYHRLSSAAEVKKAFYELENEKNTLDFIECIAVNKNDFRLAKAYKTDNIRFKNTLFNRCSLGHRWNPFYYPHFIDKSATDGAQEYLSLEDYLFRWDRGGFWMKIIDVKLQFWMRFFIDKKIEQHFAKL